MATNIVVRKAKGVARRVKRLGKAKAGPIELWIDNPTEAERIGTNVLAIGGWAFSWVGAITRITASLDTQALGEIKYGLARVDVQEVFHLPLANYGFFGLIILPKDVARGRHVLRVTATDDQGHTRQVRCNITLIESTHVQLEGQPLATPPGHYYSPIPALSDLLARADRIWPSPPPRTLPAIDLNEQHQLEVLSELARYYPEQPWTDEKQEGLRYYFQNPMYSYADALYLYGMLRWLRPQRLFEVGSGYTSSVTLDTNDRFLGGQLHCTLVDPEPERLYSLLRGQDRTRATILPQRVQEVPLTAFDSLGANDILFIDSSHVSKAGSDVNYLFFEVLPRLASGVYIHIHDVFYPFEYSRDWLEEGRHYNEDYLLRAFLMYNDTFTIELFGSYLYTFHADRMESLMPLTLRNSGGSLWLRKR